MTKIKLKYSVTFNYEQIVDSETGEVLETNLINKEIREEAPKKEAKKESKKEISKKESTTPQLILEDNKYTLNKAAIELMGVTTEDKIDIKYEKQGKVMVPIIGTDNAFGTKSGCKFSKNGSVSCRGSKNTELAKYGSIFTVVAHSSRPNLFTLIGDKQPIPEVVEPVAEDEAISFPDDISDLIDDSDVEDVTTSMFQL